jgi:predicted PurR-regulated permease PerM
VEEVVQEIEAHMSHYLWMSTVMNLGVALLTWGLLALVGFPNPLLWGALAGLVNYVPYAGPLALSIVLAVTGAISSLQPGSIVIAVCGYLLIHGLQSNLIAPTLLERKLPLNPAALFLGLMFFGWLWGVPGAILAVPLTVMIQVVCARIPAMEDVAVLLDS